LANAKANGLSSHAWLTKTRIESLSISLMVWQVTKGFFFGLVDPHLAEISYHQQPHCDAIGPG
jgi:hypothetical protein